MIAEVLKGTSNDEKKIFLFKKNTMKLWMSAEISGAYTEPYFEVRKIIENTFNQTLSKNDYGQSVETWTYIVILLPPGIAEYHEEIEKYRKSDKILEFWLKINNEQFKNGSKATQIKLVCESLLRSLRYAYCEETAFF